MNLRPTTNKRTIQILSLAAVVLLVGMGLTVLMSPSEADPGPYALTLADGESRIKKVAVPPASPSYTHFEMELQSMFPGKTGVTDIQLMVINKTFHGSVNANWKFTFLDEGYNPVPDGIYTVMGDTAVTVRLKVEFRHGIECEKVTFTVGGHNLTSGKVNETHLSPRGGSVLDVEYLTVFTGEACVPFWEPSTYADRQYKYLMGYPGQTVYHITLRNLGIATATMWLSDWEVWRDVNDNNVLDAGDSLNDRYDPNLGNFQIEFSIPGLGNQPYNIDDPLVLTPYPAPGSSVEITVTVTANQNNPNIPMCNYLIKIVMSADCNDDCDVFWDILRLNVCDPLTHPEPCVIVLQISQGWNLISIGVELDPLGGDYTASALAYEINRQAGTDIIKYVVAWHREGPLAGRYQEYVVHSDIGEDFPIDEGTGYYLYSTSPFDMEFHVVGDCPRHKSFNLLECWNLIGYRSMTPMPVGEWAQLIEDSFPGMPLIQAIVKYDKDMDPPDPAKWDYLYRTWYPGDPDDKYYVMPGEAYWIFSATEAHGLPYPA